MIQINLGSGNDYREGYINIDSSKDIKADLYLDLSTSPLPYEDNSCDRIVAIDFFEHILYPTSVLNECWRVMDKSGTLYIEVPMAGTNDYYKDPSHVRPFVPETFKYFADYAKTYKALGCKPWIIVSLSSTPNRIYVEMKPDK